MTAKTNTPMSRDFSKATHQALAALDLSYQHGAGAVDWNSVQWPKVTR